MAITATKENGNAGASHRFIQPKYNPRIVDRLFEKICREKGGNIGINKIFTVEFYYGEAALTGGPIKKANDGWPFAGDLWAATPPKAERARA